MLPRPPSPRSLPKNPSRHPALIGLLVAAAAATGATTAVAKSTNLERRNAGLYEVSPAMMHAIDVIVSEQGKMRRHRR